MLFTGQGRAKENMASLKFCFFIENYGFLIIILPAFARQFGKMVASKYS